MKKASLILVGSLALSIVLTGCGSKSTSNNVSTSTNVVQTNNERINKAKDESKNNSNIGNFQVIAKSEKSDNNVEIYIKDLKSNNEKLFVNLKDVYYQHYHWKEDHNGNLYIIRRIGDTNKEWTDELWLYGKNQTSEKLYSCKGLDFRVSQNEKYIAIEDNNKLVLIESNKAVIKTVTEDELNNLDSKQAIGALGLQGWSSNNNEFWGSLYDTEWPQAYFKISIEGLGVKKYDITNLGTLNDYSLNYDNGVLVYSDYPNMFGYSDEQIKKFEHSNKRINLYHYDLNTKKNKIIANLISKRFDPEWVDNKTLEYNGQKEKERITNKE